MAESNLKTIEEIEEIIKQPSPKDIEEYAKISDDGKSLLIRIPAKIRDNFNLKKGDYIRFFAEVKDKKVGDLIITIENEKEDKNKPD